MLCTAKITLKYTLLVTLFLFFFFFPAWFYPSARFLADELPVFDFGKNAFEFFFCLFVFFILSSSSIMFLRTNFLCSTSLIYFFLNFPNLGIFLSAQLLQSYPTLWDPMDWSPPGSSVHGILRARILEWVVISSSRGSFRPRYWTHFCIAGRFFTTETW